MRFIFFVSLTCLTISCSKNDSPVPTGLPPSVTTVINPIVKDSICRITSCKSVDGNYIVNYTLSYDDSGRLSKVVTDDGGSPATALFTYNGNKIYISIISNSWVDTVTLNSSGYISDFHESIGSFIFNTSYSYTSDTILNSTVYSSFGAPDALASYTFTNGDLTNSMSNGIMDTTSYYLDKPLVLGDWDHFYQYILHGAFAYTNKHLKKSYSNWPTYYTYTYTFESDGKIASFISDSGTPPASTFYFSYACHL